MCSVQGVVQSAGEATLRGHEGSSSPNLAGPDVLLVWLASLGVHAALLGLMFFLVFPFTGSDERPVPPTRVELVGDPDAGLSAPIPLVEPTRERTATDPIAPAELSTAVEPLTEPGAAHPVDLSIIGIGTGAAGELTRYGLSIGEGVAPEFFGLGRTERGARSVVYVVDRSGSMLDTFVHVREELKRSISELRRSQKFHVIFFNAGDPLEAPPQRLVSAIAAQKAAFFEFLQSVYPEGSTHPERAMRRALALEPDILYFLTDGEFDPGLLPKLQEWNRERRVRIYTIAYFDESGARLLESIAREHGGAFKYVTEADLH